ncbi:urocortin-2 [Lepus europaeus]|uniref:urocortin-2 n=1 Tax=Lepus europaeus TaxID=9983 RepID=UPI002B4888FD|nr:urocortin-2 [Lepus europaeus]
MTRWALPMLLVLMLGRVLAAPVTPLPVFQLLLQNRSQTTPSPAAWESPPATTTGPPATWGYRSPSARHNPRITLSLDVPIGLLQVLLEQARTRAASQQAATNARVLAQVGRR